MLPETEATSGKAQAFFKEEQSVKAKKLGKTEAVIQGKWTTQKNESCSSPKTIGVKETDILKNDFIYSQENSKGCSSSKARTNSPKEETILYQVEFYGNIKMIYKLESMTETTI